jgi:hypothetical protein
MYSVYPILNPNIEIRNPKQILNSNFQNKTKISVLGFNTLVSVIWILVILYCFEFRDSDFEF